MSKIERFELKNVQFQLYILHFYNDFRKSFPDNPEIFLVKAARNGSKWHKDKKIQLKVKKVFRRKKSVKHFTRHDNPWIGLKFWQKTLEKGKLAFTNI